jgi:hypothetical protein
MAKRVRGTATRPGQRRPLQRSGARPSTPVRPKPAGPSEAVAARPASLTPEEEARAAELEAAIVAEERAAETSRRTRAERTNAPNGFRAGSSIAVAAANEYAYVARDVRRVGIVGGSLVGVLIVLWVVVQVTGITL